jgi:hypothetical protein
MLAAAAAAVFEHAGSNAEDGGPGQQADDEGVGEVHVGWSGLVGPCL